MPGLIVALVVLALAVARVGVYDRRRRRRPMTPHDADEAARKARGRVDGIGGSWTPGSGGSSM